MDFLKSLLFDNENPLVRTVRQTVILAVSAGLTYGATAFPNISTGDPLAAAIFVGIGSVLTGLDKGLRGKFGV